MKWDGKIQTDRVHTALGQMNILPVRTMARDKCTVDELTAYIKSVFRHSSFKPDYSDNGYELCIVDDHAVIYLKGVTFENKFDNSLTLTWRQCAKELIKMNVAEKKGTMKQTFICKCGKTFQKSTKSETTGYVLEEYSPDHECYGCPYIVQERDWTTNEIKKSECRATHEITYNSRCYINTESGNHSACYIYSLDLLLMKRIFNYMKSLEGVIHQDNMNTIPKEWRAADFSDCYRIDDCHGLAEFPLFFEKNKKGTEARREVKKTFFTSTGRRKNMSEEAEKKVVLNRIEIAKENSRKAKSTEPNADEKIIPLEDLDMNIRSYNALKRAGINYVSDLEKLLQNEDANIIFARIGKKFIREFYSDYDNYIQENENMANIDFKALKNARKAVEDSIPDTTSEELAKSYNDVWGTDRENVIQIEVTRLVPFTDEEGNTQPFKLNPQKVAQIKASAEDVGIIEPLRVRRKGDIYEIISGHHRLAAAKELGQLTVPCLVGDLDDETAYKVLAESNIQRSVTLPSEYAKIFARYMKLRAEKDLTVEEIAKKFDVSRKTIYRYVALNDLMTEIQELVDSGIINIHAVELLKDMQESEQKALWSALTDNKVRLSVPMAKKLKKVSDEALLEYDDIKNIILGIDEKPEYKNKVYSKVSTKYNISMTEKELDDLTAKLLDEYFKKKKDDKE